MKRVEGKVVLVTGAGSGLGAADALMLAREGAHVIVGDVDEAAGRAVARDAGGLFIRHDVRSEDDWRAAIELVMRRFGRLDVLVNNAGNVIAADIEQTSLEQFRLLQAVHAEGTYLGCRHALAVMKERGGSIVNMASLAALRGCPAVFAYACAKGAIRALTATLATHCLDKGYPIRCNAVFPGVIATPLAVSVVGDMPGMGQPDDVAGMVLFLASDESRFVTGAEFVVDNGASVRLAN